MDVFETLERVPPIDASSDEGLKPEKVEGHVQFDSIGFSYVRKEFKYDSDSVLLILYV